MTAAARAAGHPEPSRDREQLAKVIPIWRHSRYPSRPARRPINGHHPDCPYQHAVPEHCSVCASIRKGQP